MARTMTSAAGRVNRRFLVLALILAVLSAVLVYALESRPREGGSSGTGAIRVVVAKAPIAAGTPLTADLLTTRQFSADDVADGYLGSIDGAVGQTARYPIAANGQVLLSDIVGTVGDSSTETLTYKIEDGKRAMAINVNQVISAGGLLLPGDRVDIFWVPDSEAELSADHVGAMLVGENIEVLAVQQTVVDIATTAPGLEGDEDDAGAAAEGTDDRIRGTDAEPLPEATTVTLLLTPAQVQLIYCAEAAGGLRLAVRAFGDESPTGIQPAVCVLRAEEEQGA